MARSRGTSAAAAALLLLAAVACGCCAAAARTAGPTATTATLSLHDEPGWQRTLLRLRDTPNNARAVQWMQEHLIMYRGKGRVEFSPVFLSVKYEVPPSLHDAFVEQWTRHEKAGVEAKGLEFFQLTHSAANNTDFWGYSEWVSIDYLREHLDSDTARDFGDWCHSHDILHEMFPLEPAGDTKREYRMYREPDTPRAAAARAARAAAAKEAAERRRRRRAADDDAATAKEEADPRDGAAHVAITFHVPPSCTKDFEDAFTDLQDRVVDKEDDNRFYVLRATMMNHHYVLRGGWDDLNSWLDHLTSRKFRRLREFAEENGVKWYAEPFRLLAGQQ